MRVSSHMTKESPGGSILSMCTRPSLTSPKNLDKKGSRQIPPLSAASAWEPRGLVARISIYRKSCYHEMHVVTAGSYMLTSRAQIRGAHKDLSSSVVSMRESRAAKSAGIK